MMCYVCVVRNLAKLCISNTEDLLAVCNWELLGIKKESTVVAEGDSQLEAEGD